MNLHKYPRYLLIMFRRARVHVSFNARWNVGIGGIGKKRVAQTRLRVTRLKYEI